MSEQKLLLVQGRLCPDDTYITEVGVTSLSLDTNPVRR